MAKLEYLIINQFGANDSQSAELNAQQNLSFFAPPPNGFGSPVGVDVLLQNLIVKRSSDPQDTTGPIQRPNANGNLNI
jgi:hypothetical protein